MHSEKKLTKEDTWRPAELRKHIRDKDNRDGHSRRRDDDERKHRGGQSVERRHRDPVESRPERDKERDRRHGDSRDRQRKDGSHDRRGDKDRGRRDDEDRRKRADDGRDRRETAPGKEDLRERERHRDRHKDKEKERAKVKEKHPEEDRDKRREDREKERRREEQEREQRRERRRRDESDEVRRDPTEKLHREPRDRKHRGEHEDKRRDRVVQEDRRRTEDREYKEEVRRHKEERERRHKERRRHDETHKHDSASRERQDSKQSADDVRSSRGDRERTERDKHKERRKKEEETDIERRHKERGHREAEDEDVERNHRARSGSKKSSSGKSPTYEKREEDSNPQTAGGKNGEEKAEKADLAEQEYEEDFEKLEYEEDFEDVEESADEGEDGPDVDDGKEGPPAQASKEIEAIRRAMAEENERAGSARSRHSAVREEQEDKPGGSEGSERNQGETSRRGKFIDFVAAKQREVSQKVATRQKKRSTELLRLIDLDVTATFSLLDLPPVSEYEMYIKSFGNANAKQAYVQCNEDDTDRDVQTEEIEMCEKWTQHPPEYSGACGDPNPSQEARDKTRGELVLDSQRLMSFLRSASQVMVVLLEEDQAERKSLRKLKTQKDSLSFSDGSLQLNAKLPFLLGRQISLVHFSPAQKHTMLSVHTPTATASAVRLDSCAVVCVWNIWEPSRPQQILVYGSEVQCCCFSPGKSSLVFAGTPVGSVVLWDLREHSSTHYRLKIGEDDWTFRHPTFSTDAVMCGSGHVSPVTSVEVVPSFAAGRLRPELPPLASEEESSGLSFQLASLDESGLLNFWVVVELPRGNEAGSPTDLGLRPGGKVKLLHSSSLLTVQRPSLREAAKTKPFQTLLLKYHPTDSNQFFIGTSLGLVSHGTSHGLKAPPQFYRFQEVDERTADVSAIHFSPFRPNLFLVGCADGSIRLHAVSHDRPLAEWMNSTAGEAVVSLQWAQTRPAVFCVFDAASNLHVWDMLKDDAQPVLTEKMTADRVTAMAVFGDSRQQNTYSGIALAHESGNIELRYFTQTLTVPSPAEEGKLESLLTEAF
ncbi:WD repeat-containing protein 60 [Fundulus heteroclitus]|uniref:WD repeat-containing protein 60 n=1 Tax=Fundulus heteroclitus TaxID=8078 RepID=UPI00165C03F9|nr:WD repeat-containing protein 60 [Fundulus heteroclitus]